MIEPYKMIVVNAIALGIVAFGCFFYRYIFPKKPINLFFLLLALTTLTIISIFRKGTYESGDFNMHIYRGIEFYKNIQQGNIMPSWGGELNNTYGYPIFIFNYVLHYYLMGLFHFFGLSFLNSMKLFLILSTLGSSAFMFLWAERIFKNKLAAFTAGVFFVFNPYHLMTLHFRVNGENFAYALVPMILLAFEKLIEKPSLQKSALLGLLYGLLFFAHSATAIFFLFLFIPYVFLKIFLSKQKKKSFLYCLPAAILALLFAAPVFYAHLVLSSNTYGYLLNGNISYMSLQQILYSTWRMGLLFQGPRGEFAFIIGYTQMLVSLIILFLLIRNKINKKYLIFVIFWLISFFFFSFLITPYSILFWKAIPLLSQAQFSFRMLFIVGICSSILAGYLSLLTKNKIFIYILIALTISYTILNWGNRRVIPEIGDQTLMANIPSSTPNYEGLALAASPKWLKINSLWEKQIPKRHFQIIEGQGEAKELVRKETYHAYLVNADTSLQIREHTLYFPGWTLTVDKKEYPFVYTSKNFEGKITATIPKGIHLIELTYQDIPEFAQLKKISLISLLLVLAYLGFSFFKLLKKKFL